MVLVQCMPDTNDYKYTQVVFNTSWFPTATMVARTHLSVPYSKHRRQI